MTEGDVAFVVIRVDLVDGEEKRVLTGVADNRFQAESFVSKAEKCIPEGEKFPRFEIEEVIVI